jgi:hypothetical protein
MPKTSALVSFFLKRGDSGLGRWTELKTAFEGGAEDAGLMSMRLRIEVLFGISLITIRPMN